MMVEDVSITITFIFKYVNKKKTYFSCILCCHITVTESEIYKRLVETENMAEARLKSITLLETQKFDLVQGMINFVY